MPNPHGHAAEPDSGATGQAPRRCRSAARRVVVNAMHTYASPRRLLATALSVAILVSTACSAGDEAYSRKQVEQAFADNGLALIAGPELGDLVVYMPRQSTGSSDTEPTVNVFRDSNQAEAHLDGLHVLAAARKDFARLIEDVIVLRSENVVVFYPRGSRPSRLAKIKAALAALERS